MEDVVALINKLIEEHKYIRDEAQSLERMANDASMLTDLEDAKETFMPGRFDQKQSLQKMQELIATMSERLDGHFNREESSLLTAVDNHGERKLVTALNSLLLEHEDLRNRMAHAEAHIAELLSGGLARHQWEASAHDMRAHLSHTRKLLEAHATAENELFLELRRHLSGEKD